MIDFFVSLPLNVGGKIAFSDIVDRKKYLAYSVRRNVIVGIL